MTYSNLNLRSRGRKFTVSATNDLTGKRVSATFDTDQAMKYGMEIGTLNIARVCEYALKNQDQTHSA